MGLRYDIDALLAQRRYSPQAVALASIVDRLFQGGRFFANGTPKQLRKIADELESQIKIEDK